MQKIIKSQAMGKCRWAIAEGYIPPYSTNPDNKDDLKSHEAACILNAGDSEAEVTIFIFFTDRDPVGPYRVTVQARRTLHLRFNDLREPESIPVGTPYSSVIESNVPIVVQHTRLDSRERALSLLSTIAYSGE